MPPQMLAPRQVTNAMTQRLMVLGAMLMALGVTLMLSRSSSSSSSARSSPSFSAPAKSNNP
jgi:hypothetical protein